MLKKISPHGCLSFYAELKPPSAHCLGYPNFVNTMEISSLYQLTALKKIFFCSQKSITLSLYPKIHKPLLSF